jgi:hypothetical protein
MNYELVWDVNNLNSLIHVCLKSYYQAKWQPEGIMLTFYKVPKRNAASQSGFYLLSNKRIYYFNAKEN